MSNVNILIIDDEIDFADTLKEALEIESGFSVKIYSNLDDALVSIESNAPSIILSDVFMATGSGLRLVHELEERNINLPVIYITGMIDKLPNTEGLTMLRKPIKTDVLIELIKKKINA
jgi:two-component system phosphoglycerate transport system response regulator PgtA